MRFVFFIVAILVGFFVINMLFQNVSVNNYEAVDLKTLRVSEQRENIQKMIKKYGENETYDLIKEMFKDSYSGGHNALHIFGEELYESKGAGGIGICDEEFAYGCIHGFSTQALKDKGLSILFSLDSACKKTSMEMACSHGLGHGALEYFGRSNIEKALDACASLPGQFKLYGCQDGVYMEYNFPNLAIANSASEPRVLDSSNPYSPCLSVAEKYRNACFYSLAQWWSGAFDIKFPEMGKYCEALDNYFYRRSCFLGIGNEASPYSENDINKSVERCKQMPTLEGETVCRAAVYTNYYSRFGAKVAEVACKGIPDSNVEACRNYSIIGELKN